MISIAQQTSGETPLDELLGLIEDLDDSVALADERQRLIKDIRASGISAENRSRLAGMFAKQEKLLADTAAEQEVLINQVRSGVEQAGALTAGKQAETNRIAALETAEMDHAGMEFASALAAEERGILQGEEAEAATYEAGEIASIKDSLRNRAENDLAA